MTGVEVLEYLQEELTWSLDWKASHYELHEANEHKTILKTRMHNSSKLCPLKPHLHVDENIGQLGHGLTGRSTSYAPATVRSLSEVHAHSHHIRRVAALQLLSLLLHCTVGCVQRWFSLAPFLLERKIRLREVWLKRIMLDGSVIHPMGRPFCFRGNPNKLN